MSPAATPSLPARYASFTIASSIRSTIRSRVAGFAPSPACCRCGILSDRPAVVRIEPDARLAPESPGLDQLPFCIFEGRNQARVTSRNELVVDPAGCGEAHIDAGEVHQLERAHRIARRPAASTLGMLATPASSIASASSVNGRLTRLTMNPGASWATTVGLAPALHQRHRAYHRIAIGLRRSTTSTSGNNGPG